MELEVMTMIGSTEKNKAEPMPTRPGKFIKRAMRYIKTADKPEKIAWKIIIANGLFAKVYNIVARKMG